MRVGKKNSKKEKNAMSISMYGNLFFVIIEIVIAVWTGSQAVLLDGVYDGVEFLMLLPSVFLIHLLYKPSNERHPYGYMQMETVFLVIKGIMMISVTVGLIANSINILIHGGRVVDFEFVGWFELAAFLIGAIVTFLLHQKNKHIYSKLVAAEIQDWKIDTVISFGMTVAFFLPVIFDYGVMLEIAPYLDSVITIILSIIMIPAPIKIVVDAVKDLMLIPPGDETIEEIKNITEPIIKKSNCVDCHYDIVKTGRKLWISAYITLNKDELSVNKFQILQTECIAALAKRFSNFYFELLPEIEFHKDELVELNETETNVESSVD